MDDQELGLFQPMITRCLAQEVVPFYQQWEEAGEIPRSLWLALGATLAVNVRSPDHWSLPLVFVAGLAVGGVVLRRHLRRRSEAYRPRLVSSSVA